MIEPDTFKPIIEASFPPPPSYYKRYRAPSGAPPPPLPLEGAYTCFGVPRSTSNDPMKLEDVGRQQLYSPDPASL